MALVPAILLAGILVLLVPGVQQVLLAAFKQRQALIFVIPVLLSAVFLAAAARLDSFNAPLGALILTYTFLPVICAYLARRSAPPAWLDFVIIALLWFPLEFSAGQQWVPKPARNALHLAAYGVSI